MLGGRQCAGAKFGSLNISPATHVEACVDSFEDRGSTPLASKILHLSQVGSSPLPFDHRTALIPGAVHRLGSNFT